VSDDGVAAQLRHPDLKRDPRPQARLLEEHGEALVLEELLLFAAGCFEGTAVPSRLAARRGEVHIVSRCAPQAPGRRHC